MKKLTIVILALMHSMCSMAQYITYSDLITFEAPANYLFIDSSATNLWQIGAPNKPVFNSAYSIPNAIVTDTLNSYTPNNNSAFILKLEHESFSEQQMTHITFRHQYDTDSITDYGVVEVSYDEGDTWVKVALDNTYEIVYTRIYPSGNGSGQYIASGQSLGWCKDIIDWIWYWPVNKYPQTNYPENIWIKFHFISDSIPTVRDGWMIDNIHIYADYYTGIEANKEIVSRPFPNSCQNYLFIQVPSTEGQDLSIYIYDLMGRNIMRKRFINENIQINTSGLNNGTFVYRIINNQSNSSGLGKFTIKK